MTAGVFDPAGWLQRARRIASPNCDARPAAAPISLLVVHNISLPPHQFGGDGVIDLFCNRLDPRAHPFYAGIAGVEVSSHFFIRRDGELIQFVPCGLRAWHAGASVWKGAQRCNDFSIGVELEGLGLRALPRCSVPAARTAHPGAAGGLPDRGHRRAQRHRAWAQDRSRAFLRLGSLSLAD